MLLTNCAFCNKLTERSISVHFRTFFEAFFEKNAEMVFANSVANMVFANIFAKMLKHLCCRLILLSLSGAPVSSTQAANQQLTAGDKFTACVIKISANLCQYVTTSPVVDISSKFAADENDAGGDFAGAP